MGREIAQFDGGMDSQRDHLNELVNAINDLRADVDLLLPLLNRNVLRCNVSNLTNDRTLTIEISDALIIENNEFYCCCESGSGAGIGDA